MPDSPRTSTVASVSATGLVHGAAAGTVVIRAESEGKRDSAVVTVTADPSEGEAFTESTANLVEQVPMPASIQEIVAAFVAEHHVEREFFKRKRDRADPESLARRRGYGDHDD